MKNYIVIILTILALSSMSEPALATDVIVLNGLDEFIEWLEAEKWWGEQKNAERLSVPHALITGIGPRWRETAPTIPVTTKKELFYRFLLPLIMHANGMVLDRRSRLEAIAAQLQRGTTPPPDELRWLAKISTLLRITGAEESSGSPADSKELQRVVQEALYKLDVIPAGLALGQAAYESGYGTSRFTAEGNALFGQWTFGGTGLVPEQQRSDLGDHRIAAFDWPFDSVRGYFINLNSHPAYDDFRKLRAELRSRGEPLDSLVLADGLIHYSERGQAYVDTLKGIIRVNHLSAADEAVFRDEPVRFLVGADDETDAVRIRTEIEAMRRTGELDALIARMALE